MTRQGEGPAEVAHLRHQDRLLAGRACRRHEPVDEQLGPRDPGADARHAGSGVHLHLAQSRRALHHGVVESPCRGVAAELCGTA